MYNNKDKFSNKKKDPTYKKSEDQRDKEKKFNNDTNKDVDRAAQKVVGSIKKTQFGASSFLISEAQKFDVTTNIEELEEIPISEINESTGFRRYLSQEDTQKALGISEKVYMSRVKTAIEEYFNNQGLDRHQNEIPLDDACYILKNTVSLSGLYLKGVIEITAGSNYGSGYVNVNPYDVASAEDFVEFKQLYSQKTFENVLAAHGCRSMKVNVHGKSDLNRAFPNDLVCIFVKQSQIVESRCFDSNFDNLRMKVNESMERKNLVGEEKEDNFNGENNEIQPHTEDDRTLSLKAITWTGIVASVLETYIGKYETEDDAIEGEIVKLVKRLRKEEEKKRALLELSNDIKNEEQMKENENNEITMIKAEIMKLVNRSKSIVFGIILSSSSKKKFNLAPAKMTEATGLTKIADKLAADISKLSRSDLEIMIKPINSKLPPMLVNDILPEGMNEGKLYLIRFKKSDIEKWIIQNKAIVAAPIAFYSEIDDYETFDQFALANNDFTWDKYDEDDDRTVARAENEMQELMNNIWEETLRCSDEFKKFYNSLTAEEKEKVKNYYCDVVGLGDNIKPEILKASMVDKNVFNVMRSVFEKKSNRRDFRDTLIFTIDPWSAKDFDDAVHIKPLFTPEHEKIYETERALSNSYVDDRWDYYNRLGGFKSPKVIGFEFGVHIADVTHYVTPDSAIDEKARSCTTSVYLCDRCEAMLPKRLSDCMCSLNPIVPRYCFSLTWKMTKESKMFPQNVWFGKSLMSSYARLDYVCAQEFIDENDFSKVKEQMTDDETRFSGKWPVKKGFAESIYSAVRALNQFARILREDRKKLGALTLSSEAPYFVLNRETMKPELKPVEEASEAHSLIEEYMVLANQLVARRIVASFPNMPVLRTHPPPFTKEGVATDLAKLGYSLDMTNGQSISRSLLKIAGDISEKEKATLNEDYFLKHGKIKKEHIAHSIPNLSFMMSSLSPAKYIIGMLEDYQLLSHWGIAVNFYMHFTSPIRRYADDIAHRMLALAISLENEFYSKFPTLRTHFNYNEKTGTYEPIYEYDISKQEEAVDGNLIDMIDKNELQMDFDTAVKIKKYRPHTLDFLETISFYGIVPTNQVPPSDLRAAAEKITPADVKLRDKSVKSAENNCDTATHKNQGFSSHLKELYETGTTQLTGLNKHEVKKLTQNINDYGASEFANKEFETTRPKRQFREDLTEESKDFCGEKKLDDGESSLNEEKKEKIKGVVKYVINSATKELELGLNYSFEKIKEIFELCNEKAKMADSASDVHSEIFMALQLRDIPTREIKTFMYPIFVDQKKFAINFLVPGINKVVTIKAAVYGTKDMFVGKELQVALGKNDFYIPVFDLNRDVESQQEVAIPAKESGVDEHIVKDVMKGLNDDYSVKRNLEDFIQEDSEELEEDHISHIDTEIKAAEQTVSNKVGIRFAYYKPIPCFIRERNLNSVVEGTVVYIAPEADAIVPADENIISFILEKRKLLEDIANEEKIGITRSRETFQ